MIPRFVGVSRRCARTAPRPQARASSRPARRRRAASGNAGLGSGADPRYQRCHRTSSPDWSDPWPSTDRVKQILSWYNSDNPGTLTNLSRLLNTGTLAGTGKLVILPVDQGFEHGPAALVRAEPRGLRSRLPLPARHRLRLQRVRGAARLARGGRRQVRRAGPADPQAQQQRHAREDRSAAQRDHRLGRGRAPPRLRRRSATRSTRARASATRCTRTSGRSSREAKAQGPRRRRVGLPARRRPLEGRRDRRSTSAPTPRRSPRSSARTSSRSSRRRTHIEQAEAKKVFEKFQHPDRRR